MSWNVASKLISPVKDGPEHITYGIQSGSQLLLPQSVGHWEKGHSAYR